MRLASLAVKRRLMAAAVALRSDTLAFTDLVQRQIGVQRPVGGLGTLRWYSEAPVVPRLKLLRHAVGLEDAAGARQEQFGFTLCHHASCAAIVTTGSLSRMVPIAAMVVSGPVSVVLTGLLTVRVKSSLSSGRSSSLSTTNMVV